MAKVIGSIGMIALLVQGAKIVDSKKATHRCSVQYWTKVTGNKTYNLYIKENTPSKE